MPDLGRLRSLAIFGYLTDSRPLGPDITGAIDLAFERLRSVPALVSLTGHRYLPAAPTPSGAPVLSAYQTDVIHQLYAPSLHRRGVYTAFCLCGHMPSELKLPHRSYQPNLSGR